MNKKALCVGVNVFKNYPQAKLNGCINDVCDMTNILKDYLDFKDSDIVTLVDKEATKAEIINNLKSMVDDAKVGKYNHLFFSFSSHGTQIPDTNGDEPDKLDEAFCPYDLAQAGDNWDQRHLIVDDEFYELFSKLPKDVLLEVYLDTCHSGTGLKAVNLLIEYKPRYLPHPSLGGFGVISMHTLGKTHQPVLDRDMAGHQVLWSACESGQTSADAAIDKSWHGAFTYYLCKEIRDSDNKLSRAELLKRVRASLKQANYQQTPQLECEAVLENKTIFNI